MVSRRDWQHCSALQTFKETVQQDGAFLHPRCLSSNTYGNPHNFHGHGKINDTDIGYIPDFGVYFSINSTKLRRAGVLV